MTKKQKTEFKKFLSDVEKVKDAEKLICEISNEFSNVILLAGEVLGEDTLDKIREVGRKHGFQTLTSGISVMYRTPKTSFRVE